MTKVTYQTKQGKFFRTIAPVAPNEVEGYMYQHYNMDGITVWSASPTIKRKYKHVCNKEVKLTQKQVIKIFGI